MSEPKPTVRISPWLGGSVLTLLVLQLGMLWLQGSMVQRQRQDIQGLREDVQAMSDSLDEDSQSGDSPADGRLSPARLRSHRRRPARAVRAAYFQEQGDQQEADARKDLDKTMASAKEAVAKARDTQQKMSISENIRKADEKAKVEAEGQKFRPWLWGAAAVALLLMVARSLRKRG
jgi:hypothetical protein